MKNMLVRAGGLVLLALLPTGSLLAQNKTAVPTPAPSASPAASPSNLDFGDFSSSAITTKAWAALEGKNYDEAIAYTAKCIDMFKTQAVAMQKALSAPPTEKDATFAQWALNDVGTCYFIQAKAYDAKGMKKESLADYKFLADNLAYAQCWDSKGWFWKPADAARDSLKAQQFDSLK
jgi:hypothetical protein